MKMLIRYCPGCEFVQGVQIHCLREKQPAAELDTHGRIQIRADQLHVLAVVVNLVHRAGHIWLREYNLRGEA